MATKKARKVKVHDFDSAMTEALRAIRLQLESNADPKIIHKFLDGIRDLLTVHAAKVAKAKKSKE